MGWNRASTDEHAIGRGVNNQTQKYYQHEITRIIAVATVIRSGRRRKRTDESKTEAKAKGKAPEEAAPDKTVLETERSERRVTHICDPRYEIH